MDELIMIKYPTELRRGAVSQCDIQNWSGCRFGQVNVYSAYKHM